MPEDQFTEDQEQLFGDQLEEDPTAEDYSFEPGQAEEISMDEVFEHGPEELDGDLLSGPEPESGAAGEGTPMDGGTGAGGETRGFKFPEPNPSSSSRRSLPSRSGRDTVSKNRIHGRTGTS